MIKIFNIKNIDQSYLKNTINSTFISEGSQTRIFENKIKKITGSPYSITFSNWTLGLQAGLIHTIKKGDKIIVPNNTFVASINSIIAAKGVPILCDTDKNFNFNYKLLEKILQKYKISFLMVVPLYGSLPDLTIINSLKKKYKFKIIEDSAQSLFARYDDKSNAGTKGIWGGFSLYGNKILTSGEGGVLITKSKKLYRDLLLFKNHGRTQKGSFRHEQFGLNYCYNDLSASVALGQLKNIKEELKKKRFVYKYYLKNLDDKKVKIFRHSKYSNHWLNIVSYKSASEKAKITKKLLNHNIQTRDLFYPIEKQSYIKKLKIISFSNNEYNSFYKRSFIVPSHSSLSINNLLKICKILNS